MVTGRSEICTLAFYIAKGSTLAVFSWIIFSTITYAC